MISTSPPTPWLSKAILQQWQPAEKEIEKSTNRQPKDGSSIPITPSFQPPSKLAQILSRGGPLWHSRDVDTNARKMAAGSSSSSSSSWMIVSDGEYSIRAVLTPKCIEAIQKQVAMRIDDPFVEYGRGCVGVLKDYRIQVVSPPPIQSTNEYLASQRQNQNQNQPQQYQIPNPLPQLQVQIEVNVWICKPNIKYMVAGTDSFIQPIMEHIPIRRALEEKQTERDRHKRNQQMIQEKRPGISSEVNSQPITGADAINVLKDPNLVQEIFAMLPSDGESEKEDSEPESDTELDLDSNSENQVPLMNLQDMFGTQGTCESITNQSSQHSQTNDQNEKDRDDHEDDEDDNNAPETQPLTQPHLSQIDVSEKLISEDRGTTLSVQVPIQEENTGGDTESTLLTHAQVDQERDIEDTDTPLLTQAPMPTMQRTMVEASTQTSVSDVAGLQMSFNSISATRRTSVHSKSRIRDYNTPQSIATERDMETPSYLRLSQRRKSPKRSAERSARGDKRKHLGKSPNSIQSNTRPCSQLWESVREQLDDVEGVQQIAHISAMPERARKRFREGRISLWLHQSLVDSTAEDEKWIPPIARVSEA